MVGGAPVTEAYAEQIGADGYSSDASAAAPKARELLDVKVGAAGDCGLPVEPR